MLIAAFKKVMRELEEQRILQQEERLSHRFLERGTQYRHRGKMRNLTKRGKGATVTVFRQVKKGLVDKEGVRLDEREENLDGLRERLVSKGNRTEAVLEEPKANTPISKSRPNKAPSNDFPQSHGSNIDVGGEGKGTGKGTGKGNGNAKGRIPSIK